jgi:hypothetical protein
MESPTKTYFEYWERKEYKKHSEKKKNLTDWTYDVRFEVFPADCVDKFFTGSAPGDFVHCADVSPKFFFDVLRAEMHLPVGSVLYRYPAEGRPPSCLVFSRQCISSSRLFEYRVPSLANLQSLVPIEVLGMASDLHCLF